MSRLPSSDSLLTTRMRGNFTSLPQRVAGKSRFKMRSARDRAAHRGSPPLLAACPIWGKLLRVPTFQTGRSQRQRSSTQHSILLGPSVSVAPQSFLRVRWMYSDLSKYSRQTNRQAPPFVLLQAHRYRSRQQKRACGSSTRLDGVISRQWLSGQRGHKTPDEADFGAACLGLEA